MGAVADLLLLMSVVAGGLPESLSIGIAGAVIIKPRRVTCMLGPQSSARARISANNL